MTRLTIDELEMLNPFELGELLLTVVGKDPLDLQYIQDFLDVGSLIDIGAKDGMTALHAASRWGKLEVVEFLISKGANIHARHKWGRTALNYAAIGGHLEVVKFLVSNGADVNSGCYMGWTALHSAAHIGHPETVKYLISRGADVNARTHLNNRPWDVIKKSKIDKIIEVCPELRP